MKEKCDVVVIGAGIAGLSVAARLAYSGYKIVLLEKATVLGGRFTYAEYKGYKLPVAAWMISFGKHDPVYKTMQDVGIPEMKMYDLSRIRRRYKVSGKEFDLPEKGGVQTLISYASRDKAEEEKVMAMVRRALRWQEPSDTISFKEWLFQYTDNEEIYKVFQGVIKAWLGMNGHELPAGEFFRIFRNIASSSIGLIPKNGLNDIIDALEGVIRNNGGKVWTRTVVKQIVVDEEGVAKGVIAQGVKEKLEVEARAVISNVGPKETINLAGEINFDKGYLKEVAERIRPAAGMNFLIASDQPLFDDIDWYCDMDSSRLEWWVDLSAVYPGCVPEGKHLISSFVCPDSTLDYDPQKEYEAVLKDLEKAVPKFKEHGEILLAHNFCGVWPVSRSWSGYMVTQKTPIEYLYNVGDAVNPTGWPVGAGAAESARIVAEDVKARIKL